MPIVPLKTNVRSVDDLTDDLKAEIRRLYVDEELTINVVAERTGIRYPIVGKYLRQKRLTRSFRQYAKKSPWARQQKAGWAERESIRKREEREQNA